MSYEYDSLGRIIKEVNPQGGVQTISNNADGGTTHISEVGVSSRTAYNALAGTENRVQTNTSAAGEISITQKFLGKVYTYAADGSTQLSVIRNDGRLGNAASYVSDSTSNDGAGAVRTLINRTYTIRSLFDFDKTETVTSGTATLNSVYQSSNKVTVATSGIGRTQKVQINNQEQVILSQKGNFAPVNYQYDQKGRLANVSQGARSTQLSYDSAGNLSKTVDALGRVMLFGYDSVNRLTAQTMADGSVVQFAYDQNGNRVSLTPPDRGAHAFDFGAFDFTSVVYSPSISGENYLTRYTYDNARRLSAIERPDNQVVNIIYEQSTDRVVKVQSGNTYLGTTYYPTNGNISSRVSSDGISSTFQYRSSLISLKQYSGSVNASVQYGFNQSVGLLSKETVGQNEVAYQYDNDKLVVGIGQLSLVRDTLTPNVLSTSIGNLTEQFSYNQYGEVSQKITQYGGTDLYKESYVRDALGRILKKTVSNQQSVKIYEYAYDISGRLSDVKVDGTPVSHYDYDRQGNRLGNSATYDAQDRLLTYGPYQYSYTKNGDLEKKLNTLNNEFSTYVYDVFGQLKSVKTANGTQIEYLTNGENQRAVRKVNGNITHKYVYGASGNLIAQLDANDNLVARFVYGSNAGAPEYFVTSSGTYKIIKDQLGSVRVVVDVSSGTVVQYMEYDAFGNVVQDTNPGFQPFGFAGGLYDSATGLVRFGARDYDPEIGRWTSKDPILFSGGGVGPFSRMETNLYGYSFNDPINFIDTNGEFPKNIDEAGECIFGNPTGLVDSYLKNIQRNNAEIQSLQNQSSASGVCQDNAGAQKRINYLQGINKSLQGTVDQINNKCSYFYKGGL